MAGRRSTTQRGYGAWHQRLRLRWAPRVAAGVVDCSAPLCLAEQAGSGRRINPGEPWDLGHDETDRRRYAGPQHAACNRGAPRRTVPDVTPAVDPQPRPTSSW
jgi:hypothetical protein